MGKACKSASIMDATHIPPSACEQAFKRPKTQDSHLNPPDNPFEPIAATSAISIHLVDPDLGKCGDAAHCTTSAVTTFNPEYTHQVFGNEEEIKGYKGLEVVVLLDTNTFYSQATVRYEDSLDGADDVVGKLTDALQPGLLQSSEVFEEKVREYQGDWLDLEDLGNVVEQHPWRHGKLTMSYDVLSNASSKLKELHGRLEPFMTFFIDGFERIDSEDPNWEIYVASYQTKSSLRVVGFAVVYNLLAFPRGKRKKLGQLFVVPNHQGGGVGTGLLKAVHKVAEDGEVVDVTLVDPSPSMRTVRDKWDIERMVMCQWTRELASQALLLWEGLLMVEAKGDPDLVALVRDFVECRMVNIWGTGAVSNKIILQTKNDDGSSRDNFIMLRCRNIPPIDEAMRRGLILMPAEVCLPEEKKDQICSEVDQRMEELTSLAIKYWQ